MFKKKVFISKPPVNDMLNKRQIELLTLHHICSGGGGKCTIVIPHS